MNCERERESVCENDKFKLEKWFMVLKKINHFTRINLRKFFWSTENVFDLITIFDSTKY
jgi:hypothetical protein